MDAANPLLPATSDLVWSGLAVVALGLAVWAVLSLSRRARDLSSAVVAVWAVVILLVPVLGPLAWILAGRRARGDVARS